LRAGGSRAAGGATHADRFLKEVPNKKKNPGPPGFGLGVGLTFSSHKNTVVSKLQNKEEAMARKRAKMP
jgi:hypothetical protein